MPRFRNLAFFVLFATLFVIGAVAAIPTTRHAALAFWNDPADMPALGGAPNVHYEPGAESQARAVVAVLPRALARIEAVQGRPFAHRVTIGVYASPETYARANGIGSPGPGGVTFFGRVTLSPALFGVLARAVEDSYHTPLAALWSGFTRAATRKYNFLR